MGKEKFLFQKLTPTDTVDISVYEEAINFIFTHKDIRNVAISGPYSAGKSSVIESYKKKYEDKKFVHLSLAYFRKEEKTIDKDNDSDSDEAILEGKILNQLIHQIPSDRIPQTNFRVKKGIKKRKLVVLTSILSVFVASILYFIFLGKIRLYVATLPKNTFKNFVEFVVGIYSPIVVFSISVFCGIFFIYSLTKLQKIRNIFRKLNFQGNEIEIFEGQDESYFDKYLNEVLYLFENVEADVIVFEDMDRFDATKIFERLREVNTLVNLQRKKDGGENYIPIRFFYLLRDDIFISKDRTKFFDYIVPIIPVVDSSNSYDQFIKHLKEAKIFDKFDSRFLESLSLYIDDMRILKNIYNEFIVYINRLNNTELDWNKMLALIAYKNLFPRDFNDLQLGKGFIFEIFHQKENLVKKLLEKATKDRSVLDKRIEAVKNEILRSEEELTDVYNAQISRIPRDYYGQYTKENKEKLNEYRNELEDRKNFIQTKCNNKIPELERNLKEIERKISLIESMHISELLNNLDGSDVFSIKHKNEIGVINEFKEIKGNDYFDLLKYLIRTGNINETYPDYMTYFYEDSLSAGDKTFLRMITDKHGRNYGYSLKNPERILDSSIIRTVEFEHVETLNYDLLVYLLNHSKNERNQEYLKTLLNQVRTTSNFKFLSEFYDREIPIREFIVNILNQWPDLFFDIENESEFTEQQIKNLSIDILTYYDTKKLNDLDRNYCLRKYIGDEENYLEIKNPNIKKIVDGLTTLEVQFLKLNYDSADKKLFELVYKKNLYELNLHNVRLLLQVVYGIEKNDLENTKILSLVREELDSALFEYTDRNIQLFSEVIFNAREIMDNSSSVIYLLNHEELKEESKKEYISRLSTTVPKLSEIRMPAIWSDLLGCGIAEFSFQNIFSYFEQYKLNDKLIDFINKQDVSAIDFSIRETSFSQEIVALLFEQIATCNELNTVNYIKILSDLGFSFTNFESFDIEYEKMDLLIENKILEMGVESLHYLRNHYTRSVELFIKTNIDEYLLLLDGNLFNLNEAIYVSTLDLEEQKLIDLFSLTHQSISVIDNIYSDSVSAFIIQNNLDEQDLANLCKNYSNYGVKTKNAIESIFESEEMIDEVIDEKFELDNSLLMFLFQNDEVSRESKINLFNSNISYMDIGTIKMYLDHLQLSELKEIFSTGRGSGRRNYKKDSEVTSVLNAFKENNLIHSFKEDDRNQEKYIIVKAVAKKEFDFLD